MGGLSAPKPLVWKACHCNAQLILKFKQKEQLDIKKQINCITLRPLTSKVIIMGYTYLNSLVLLTASPRLHSSWQKVHFKQEMNCPDAVTHLSLWLRSVNLMWRLLNVSVGHVSKGISMSPGAITLAPAVCLCVLIAITHAKWTKQPLSASQ